MGVSQEMLTDEPITPRLGANDPLLTTFLCAGSPAARSLALEQLILAHATPIVEAVLTRYRHTDGALATTEAEDIASSVIVRLVERLLAISDGTGSPIAQFEGFTATVTYHAIYDLMRTRHPEWTRLRNRVRHVLTRDPRFTTQQTPSGMLCGVADSRRQPLHLASEWNRERPAEAIEAILRRAGVPMMFDELLRTLAEIWNVGERPPREEEGVAAIESEADRLESRRYLEKLWSEILELRAPQRAALLLNLRDGDGGNAVSLLILVGIATLPEIAQAMELPIEQLAGLWNELPLDDRSIATMLGVSRQQVINLRKSARARLARRMRS